ncbi:hypothetical protein TVAG_083030 [Trichomonas vaginalis G3]|uniref:Uncharacterized protein n=1 Tax=Trichomonas vaginalis (strain ATCC PRA-98 / G3) TaxID=412133 RepID=A2DM32_TRIV3|nr:hypothetical protein TVAGG3_0984350 [Trichomonas vaginalis G3]EAY18452.1 hypothetical protein TVAG_083030 [Trichomonas vaginalis G3]KAI5489559.1 hypothetical protein TVAGG3_0984350 [Trichomonas vaginalis G3]|eukprot:XP_001579438.1 hypothetical protein [Trichomonas vaginalis G3]
MVGVNTYCDKFERLARLPPNSNETSGIKKISVVRNTNKIEFSIITDFIFHASFDILMSNLKIKISSKFFDSTFTKRSLWDYKDQNPKNITFYICVSQAADAKLELVSNELVLYSENMNIDPVAFLLPKRSWGHGKDDSPMLTDFCLSGNRITTFVYEDFFFKHPLSSNYNNFTHPCEDFKKQYNYKKIMDNSPIYFLTNNYEQSLKISILPILQELYNSQFRKRLIVSYTVNTPIIKLFSKIPQIKLLDSSTKCFNQNKFPVKESSDYSYIRKAIPITENKINNTILIIASNEMQKVPNIQSIINEKKAACTVNMISQNTPTDQYIQNIKTASEIWIFDEPSAYCMIYAQPGIIITHFMQNIPNWEFELARELGIFLSIADSISQSQNSEISNN